MNNEQKTNFKTLNEYRNEAYRIASDHGFHNETPNLGELLMLITSELSEALEADRMNNWHKFHAIDNEKDIPNPETLEYKQWFNNKIRGTVEEEIADALIRLFDLAGVFGIDLDWIVKAKMAYNETRAYKHGKEY